MTNQEFEAGGSGAEQTDVISVAQGGPGLLRQVGNGLGGLLVLGLSGLILIIVVLVKSR